MRCLMYTSDLRASLADSDSDYFSYEDLRVARFFVLKIICTVKLDTHIDMLIENKIGNLAWDGNLTAVKIEGESMKEIFLLGFKSRRKNS